MLYFIMQATSDMENKNTSESHFQFNDESFLIQLEDGSMRPNLFGHEAHLRMAWLYIKKYGVKNAVDRACSTIRRYDFIHGSGNKFHVTLTAASVKVVHHFIQKSTAKNFPKFMLEHPVLKVDFSRLLLQHYGQEVLRSNVAKNEFVEPDLLPF